MRRSKAQLNAISRAYQEKREEEARRELERAYQDGIKIQVSKYAQVNLRRIAKARELLANN